MYKSHSKELYTLSIVCPLQNVNKAICSLINGIDVYDLVNITLHIFLELFVGFALTIITLFLHIVLHNTNFSSPSAEVRHSLNISDDCSNNS